ncbi:MAG TPA: thioesterase family protein [Parvularculaceae bacterium]|nr:thioesterase family protein [Parvularculaceae bacterium]
MTSRTDFAFLQPIRVRWAECDAQAIVFNANYFLYFDVAMTEWMRSLGFDGDETLEFVTAHAEADYRASARYDEEIEVAVRCARLGHKSMTLAFAIFRASTLLTEGALT